MELSPAEWKFVLDTRRRCYTHPDWAPHAANHIKAYAATVAAGNPRRTAELVRFWYWVELVPPAKDAATLRSMARYWEPFPDENSAERVRFRGRPAIMWHLVGALATAPKWVTAALVLDMRCRVVEVVQTRRLFVRRLRNEKLPSGRQRTFQEIATYLGSTSAHTAYDLWREDRHTRSRARRQKETPGAD